jgi:osmoprotectant transport system permease protein
MSGLSFINENLDHVLELTRQHLVLMLTALALACLIGIPAGIVASRDPRVARVALAVANIGQAVPSIAVIGGVVPLLGIGFGPALVALTVRAILPIYLNTHLGLSGVDPAIREAALGNGLKPSETISLVEMPLASPVLMAGIRTAAVEGVGIATLAAFIGAGGLGDLILQGIAMMDPGRLLGGAIPVALLAVAAELVLGAAEMALRRRFF